MTATTTVGACRGGRFRLVSTQVLPTPLEELFPFFSDAANLELLTPSWLLFSIVTPQPIALRVGTLIDYRLRVRGIPLRWRSEIVRWNPPYGFVDRQVRGPYSEWLHEHRFEPVADGTRCVDEVRYRPRGGALVNALAVQRDVEGIFRFRGEALARHAPSA